MTLAAPWWMLGLLLWLVLPRRSGWGWRLAASALLLLALAQPSWTQPGQHLAVVVEVSEAVGTQALEAATRLAEFEGRTTIILFAARAQVFENLAVSQEQLAALRRGGGIDLAGALQLAQAQQPDRILVIGSGIESQGHALAAAPTVPVDSYPVAMVDNSRIVALLAPDEVGRGEAFEVAVIVESSREATMALRLSVGDNDLPEVRQRISAGRHTVRATATARQAGTLAVRAALQVDFPQPAADDHQQLTITVVEPATVLVVGDPALAALLAGQGIPVVSGGPELLVAPLRYAAVVVRSPAEALSEGQHQLLADYVRRGGGLLMSGGEGGFGLSGWYRSPVAEVLPVALELPSEVVIPQVAMVLVMDRSGSMRADRPTRMSLALRGAIELVENAHQSDLIGLIAFDHHYQWIFKPRPATPRGKQEMIAAIRQITPGGGTIVGPAYRQAIAALRETEAALKHIILLSDGEFFDGTGLQGPTSMGPRPDFAAIAAEALADGITTSTIGLGEADFAVMAQIAAAGGGRFHGVRNIQELPRILTAEAIVTQRSVIREGPIALSLHRHPLTLAIGNPPPVGAYIATQLKPGGELLLEGMAREPLLAVGRRELGRSSVLTTDLNRWAGELGGWAELPALIGNVVRWLQVSPEPYSLTVSRVPEGVRVVVDAVRDGEFLDGERLEASYGGVRRPLEQRGPGRYEAVLPVQPQGGQIAVFRERELIARRSASFPPASLEPTGAVERLQELTRLTGGGMLTALNDYRPPEGREPLPLWPLAALLALLVFLIELVVRRLGRLGPAMPGGGRALQQ
jgi:Mg-chelatase subunit ChlD